MYLLCDFARQQVEYIHSISLGIINFCLTVCNWLSLVTVYDAKTIESVSFLSPDKRKLKGIFSFT